VDLRYSTDVRADAVSDFLNAVTLGGSMLTTALVAGKNSVGVETPAQISNNLMGDPIVAFPLSSLGTVTAGQMPTDTFATIVYTAAALIIVSVSISAVLASWRHARMRPRVALV